MDLGPPSILNPAPSAPVLARVAVLESNLDAAAVEARGTYNGIEWVRYLVLGSGQSVYTVGLYLHRWIWVFKCEHRTLVLDKPGGMRTRNDGATCSHAMLAARLEAAHRGTLIPDPRHLPPFDDDRPDTPCIPYDVHNAAALRLRNDTAGEMDRLALAWWKQWRADRMVRANQLEREGVTV